MKKRYCLHFMLTKHKEAKQFTSTVTADEKDDLQGIKEKWAMHFEEMYGTPVKCVKVEEVKE